MLRLLVYFLLSSRSNILSGRKIERRIYEMPISIGSFARRYCVAFERICSARKRFSDLCGHVEARGQRCRGERGLALFVLNNGNRAEYAEDYADDVTTFYGYLRAIEALEITPEQQAVVDQLRDTWGPIEDEGEEIMAAVQGGSTAAELTDRSTAGTTPSMNSMRCSTARSRRCSRPMTSPSPPSAATAPS